MKYNKLVRDRIPEIMTADGELPVTRILDEVGYRTELQKKLEEEVAEYLKDQTAEELADIMEIVYALAALHDLSEEELEEARRIKREKRGGFLKRIFLVESKR